MAYTEERSPWPWVVVALGLLAFVAAVIFLTRPAEMAPPRNGDTVIVNPPARNGPAEPSDRTTIIERDDDGDGGQPVGNTTIIQRNEGQNREGASGTPPSAGTPGGNQPATTPAPSGQRGSSGGARPPAAPSAPSNSMAPGAGGGQAPADQPTGGASGHQATLVGVQMGEWFVRLDHASIPSGPARFRIHNVGAVPHGFAIEGEGTEQQGNRLDPGEKDTVTASLTPGDYIVYCYVGDHRTTGMETTLHVR